ncbi:chromatin assembly factor 1 subunit A isoform X2 [Trichomycterus rosablanca]
MDCIDKASTATKKLVQARLPFKRLNPEPKDNRETKRSKTLPSAPPAFETCASDGENEVDTPSLSLPPKIALKNGRGPLDGFMRRTKCPPVISASSAVIDLTEDSNSNDVTKTQPCAPVKALHPSNDKAANETQNVAQTKEPELAAAVSQLSEENMVVDEAEDSAALSQLDSTIESEIETEQDQKAEESQCDESLQSPVSSSSNSLIESSPEPSKSTPTTPVPGINSEQKAKRRSLKSAQELEEKKRQKEDKEREKQEAKAAKDKKREEAQRQREELKKEKQEKKEREEKERREKKEEKAEIQRAKEEQRKVKIEAKLEEKRKKEEEKRVKEEKERIKAEKAVITRFLQKPKAQLAPKTLASVCGKFAPFEIKDFMTLAPVNRVQCEDEALETLDRYLVEPDCNFDCLKDWLTRKHLKSGATKSRHVDSVSGECVVVDEDTKTDSIPDHKCYGRMKLLQFCENYRPAYWGTWRKKSTHISPRCPSRKDKDVLDYEVDSDDEWEEEEPGESLSHSEGDDDDDGDDDEEDDGFFVPHGYLSDGEGALEDEEGGDLEKQKVRQKLKAREWDELMAKRKLKVLEAVVTGCVWDGEAPPSDVLQPYAVCILEPLHNDEPNTPEEKASKQQRNEQLLAKLLPLLHGNVNSSKVIITEFQEFCRQQMSSPACSPQSSADNIPPRIHVKRLMKQNAVYEKRSTYRRCCWYVHPEVLLRFGQDALPVPCQWTYITSGAHVTREEPTQGLQNSSPIAQSTSTTPFNRRKSGSNQSITKYMKKCSEPEQAEAMETDGFQADTEDDDDDDCVILSEQSGSPEQNKTESKAAEPIDTVLSLPCPTPATA